MKAAVGAQGHGGHLLRRHSKDGDDFPTDEFGIANDGGGLRQGARHLPFHEGDAFAGVVLWIVEIRQIMNRGDRRSGKWHQNIVRGVQDVVLEIPCLPVKHLAASEIVQVQGKDFERDASADLAQRLIGAQDLFGVGEPVISRKKPHIANRRMSAQSARQLQGVVADTGQWRLNGVDVQNDSHGGAWAGDGRKGFTRGGPTPGSRGV